ncbi:type II toxin-antitoxin system prevent-host-death family antitoxin [Lentzea sp. BCCO 10_0798]|uniref:Type II toxin-antitoxin system prevent-host-death family antitoxin n=1 Tax=Lentzea kristufekii TaxID=3095430 RepID=A0ABU4TUZ6_9PSEU|nr:type II toxin-antitoxin system prevent-host-death family antitoxin [Lentzea sp. BCCO 10_0798]MDX8052100.1 type II toxin-antitoxin system prevent-host-death family antitoxin [Lentzea sp. BCCO 10_0798]
MDALNEARDLTVVEATERGVAGLIADVEKCGPVAVTRHGRRVVAVVPVSRLTELAEAAADLSELAKSAAGPGRLTSFDDVLAAFGHTRESLAAVEDDDSLDG